MNDHTREELEQLEDDELFELAVEELDYDGPTEFDDAQREGIIAALIETDEDRAEREAKQADLSGTPSTTSVDLTNVDLDKVGVPDLKDYAKEAGIKGYSNMRKHELIAALSSSTAVATVPPPDEQYPLRKSQRAMDDPDSGDDPAWAAGLSSLHRRQGHGSDTEQLHKR